MFLWNVEGMKKKLSQNAIKSYHLIAYFLVLVLLIVTGLNPFMFLPNSYLVISSYIKHYLEAEARPAQLVIETYSFPQNWYIYATIFGLCCALLITFLLYRNSLQKNLSAFMCLSVALFIRITLITSILLGIIILVIGLFYISELMSLQQPVSISLTNPASLMPHSILKAGWQAAYKYVTAQALFAQISRISYYLFLACNIGAIISALWYLLRLTAAVTSLKKEEQ